MNILVKLKKKSVLSFCMAELENTIHILVAAVFIVNYPKNIVHELSCLIKPAKTLFKSEENCPRSLAVA